MRKIATKCSVMKKKNDIRTLLGITQEKIAMLMGVSRSQWSMYELGKRELPVGTMTLLSGMILHVENQKKNDVVLPEVAQQKTEMANQFEKLLKENDYQQQTLSRKLADVRTKYAKHSAALHLTAFLKEEHLKKEEHSQEEELHSKLVEWIAKKASKGLAKNNLSLLTSYEIKLELLELEKKLILNALQKNASSQ